MHVVQHRLSAISLRDYSLVIVCCLSIYVLRVRPGFELVPKWHVELNEKSINLLNPSPLLADLNGDNKSELVTVSSMGLIQVYNISPNSYNFTSLQLIDSAQGASTNVIVLKAGYIEPYSPDHARNMSLVTVDSDWNVRLYSSQLELMWTRKVFNLTTEEASEYHIKSLTALITPRHVQNQKQGLVIVTSSCVHKEHEKLKSQFGVKSDGPTPGRLLTQPKHSSSHPLTHISSWALGTDTGEIIWHHLPGDFEQPKLKNQASNYHWKLSLHEGKAHVGESPASKFSNTINRNLPHVWSDLLDTHANIIEAFPDELTSAKGRGRTVVDHARDVFGLDKNHLESFFPHSEDEHLLNPNAVIVHHHSGLQILRLENGAPMTSLRFPQENIAYANVNVHPKIERISLDHVTCEGLVNELVQVNKILHQVPLCFAPSMRAQLTLRGLFTPNSVASQLRPPVVPPLLVPTIAQISGIVPHLLGHTLPSQRVGLDQIYLISSGRISSYGPYGDFHWQTQTKSSWSDSTKGSTIKPSMAAFSSQPTSVQNLVAVAGGQHISVVSLLDGQVLADHSLPCMPRHKLLVSHSEASPSPQIIASCICGVFSFDLVEETDYLIMVLVAISVILAILLMMWCVSPESGFPSDI